MSPAQEQQFQAHLTRVFPKGFKCPMCASEGNFTFEEVINPTVLVQGAAMRVGGLNPDALAMLRCNQCSNTLFFKCATARITV